MFSFSWSAEQLIGLVSTNTHVIQQPLLVAPLLFNLHKQFEMDAMAQQVFDIFAGADANLFQTSGAFPDPRNRRAASSEAAWPSLFMARWRIAGTSGIASSIPS